MRSLVICLLILVCNQTIAQDKGTQQKLRELVFQWNRQEDSIKGESTQVQRDKATIKMQNNLKSLVKDARITLRFPIMDIATANRDRVGYLMKVHGPIDILRQEDRAVWTESVSPIPLTKQIADDVRPGDILEVSGTAGVVFGHEKRIRSLAVLTILSKDETRSSREARITAETNLANNTRVLVILNPQFHIVKPSEQEIKFIKEFKQDDNVPAKSKKD